MADRKINVNLTFTADAQAAKRQIADLQKSLTQLTQTARNRTDLGLTDEISEAIVAVTDLQSKLSLATTSTGKLDLGQFNNSLKQSGIKLAEYKDILSSLGPEGVTAFSQVAQAVASAEISLKSSNSLLKNFATTLKNTARWELSSKIMHNFESAISSAYNYAQDLNESLNSIRIVSEKSTEEMAKFAVQANKAAKALSTTTVDYTDSSLIFFQQGLSDKEVEERTAITIKMANAAGESAQTVSDQLTAVWNNFYDGSKSLEYYADVMTKLGAATASSTDEISQGLEKFAAIADTVGLSYEYATAALTTITSNTRESADVVGTALKTIFGRMQDLELGETLEDGTTLGKYAQAMNKVGIQVLDTKGGLIDMDQILDQMAEKWETLSKSQQVALAQAVGGARQYNQIVALMANWDSGDEDSMIANLKYVEEAEGTLTEQADVYSESWQAASKEVQAALEGIYADLIDDEGFVKLLKIITKLVEGIDEVVEGLGGLKGLLPLIAVALTKAFGDDITSSIDKMVYKIKYFGKTGQEEIKKIKLNALREAETMYADFGDPATADIYQQQLELQKKLIEKAHELEQANTPITEEEKKQAEYLLDINKKLGEQYIQLVKNREAQQGRLDRSISNIGQAGRDNVSVNAGGKTYSGRSGYQDLIKEAARLQQLEAQIYRTQTQITQKINNGNNFDAIKKDIQGYIHAMEEAGENTTENGKIIFSYLTRMSQASDMSEINAELTQMGRAVDITGAQVDEFFQAVIDGAIQSGVSGSQLDTFRQRVEELRTELLNAGAATPELIERLQKLQSAADRAGERIGAYNGQLVILGSAVSQVAQTLSTFSFGLSQVKTLGENLFDPDASGIEKFTAAMSLLVAMVHLYESAEKASNAVKVISNKLTGQNTVQATANTVAQGVLATAIEKVKNKMAALNGVLATNWLGVALIAITALIGAFSAIKSSIERANEKIREEAEASREAAEAAREEAEANSELADSFDELLKKYKAGASSKEELITAAEDAADAYEIENKELLIAAGRYEELAEKIKEARKEQLLFAKSEAQEAYDDTSEEFIADMRSGKGYQDTDDKYKVNLNTSYAANNIINGLIKNREIDTAEFYNGNLWLKSKSMNAEDVAKVYEDVQTIVSALIQDATENGTLDQLKEADWFQEMEDYLEKSEESYNNYLETQKELANLNIEEQLFDEEAPKTIKEYEEIKAKVAENLQNSYGYSSERATELAEAALTADERFKDMATQSKIVEQAFNEFGGNENIEEFREFYEGLTENEQAVFGQLSFKTADSIEALENQLDYLQHYANLNEITVKISTIKAAKASLEEDMTADEYAEWQTSSGIDWGQNGVIPFSDFLKMSYQNQVAYLDEMLEEQQKDYVPEKAQTIAEAKSKKAEAEKEAEEARARVETYGFDEETSNLILSLNNFDEDSETYQDIYQKLLDNGIQERWIQRYLELNKQIEQAEGNIEYYEGEIARLNDEDNVEKIISVKTELEEADNVDDLQKAWDRNKTDFTDNVLYQEQLIKLGNGYDECADAVAKYKAAISSGEGVEEAQAELEATIRLEEARENELNTLGSLEKAKRRGTLSTKEELSAYKLMASQTTKGQKALKEYEQALKDAGDDTEAIATATDNFVKKIREAETEETAQKIHKLVEELDELTADERANPDNFDDLNSIGELLKSIFGDDLAIDAEFVLAQWDKIQKYLYGMEEDQLAAGEAMILAARANTEVFTGDLMSLLEELGIKTEGYEDRIKNVELILHNANFDAEGKIDISTAGAIANIAALADDATQVATLLSAIGQTHIEFDISAFQQLSTALIRISEAEENGEITPEMRNFDNVADALVFKAINAVVPDVTGNTKTYSKGDTKSGSSSKSTVDAKKKTEVVERYKEINDSIDNIIRSYDRATKAAERLYGKDRIDAMREANNQLKQEKEYLEQKVELAKAYLKEDEQTLKQAAATAGVNLTFDSEGRISNYTAEMTKLFNQYDALVKQVNADGNATDEEQKQVEALEKKITDLTDAIEQYDETYEELEDSIDKVTDAFNEWQDNNYQNIYDMLQLELEITELNLKYLDYYLEKIEDDFYSMAEAAQVLTDKIGPLKDNLFSYEKAYEDLNAAYTAGEISQEKYIEGLKEAYNGILDELSALNELDDEMKHYYEDTLDAASEELSKYTGRLEHLTEVLGHYKNLIELVNGEYDYESIGKILDAQAKTLKNELDVLSENYKMLLTEKEAVEQSLANAQDEAAREIFQKELDAINAAVDEAQENMLSKTEEWAEAQTAIMENAMSEAATEMEKAFTDDMGFDALSNSLDRLSSYADVYLTKTNQIYETQKLINTAQQAADKTTNEAAKVRLKAYQNEIAELQTKNKMSNLDLEIAKAKYDIVLAEIALEEAQNAKSTVRLQRDSEGNFGYVYTADQDAISQAEQDLADAQNALYNIGLEGANDYGQKLLELQQQLADELVALEEARAAGQYATDEEYYAARDKLISEYNDLFLAYSEQYTTALGVDNAIQEEAWVNAYDGMIEKSLEWKDKVTDYTEKCEDAYTSWREVVEQESEEINNILNNLTSEINDVTKASDDLRNEVVGTVIPAIKSELSAVREVTSAYAAQRAQIQELIQYYEQLALSMAKTIQQQSGVGYDPTADYSALMGTVEEGSAQYNQYKEWRERKISEGYTGAGSEVSTARIDAFYQKGLSLKDLGYNYFTEISEDEWKKLVGFASGGYTGNWGPEGKLSVLHEKELVLNADDTINLLSATSILRDIVKSIDLQAYQNQAFVGFNAVPQMQENKEILEQNVRIEASFPNVQDRNEIQEAFNTLINTASQYANRK